LKPVRWSNRALKTLEEREIDRREAERTLKAPEKVIPGRSPREILIRRYNDVKLQQEMALCILVEETDTERVVVTLYKTSQIKKYLEGTQR
jgi:hypothetical protein